jgi:cell division protein FtsW
VDPRSRYPDQVLLFVTLSLLAIGLVMVYSSSSVVSMHKYDDSVFFVKKQAWRILIGLFLMVVFVYLDYRKLVKISAPLCLLFTALLILVYVPGVGVEGGGSKRWIDFFFRIQPSEYFKVFYILFLAGSLSQISRVKNKFSNLILPHLLFLTFVSALVLFQPDLSTALLIALIGFFMIFSLYSSPKVVFIVAILSTLTLAYQIWKTPYRLRRVVAFLNPADHQLSSGYQLIQSKISLGSGGFIGLGLGQSRQKYLYLPEEHTDFIFAILGEEFGFLGSFLIILGFSIFLFRGIRIALRAPDYTGKLLAYGVTGYITIQVLLNLMVVAGLAPPTGLPLPFLSYGGNAMITNLLGVGILLNISRYVDSSR